jgi:1,4-alpha-glucan branching enzyme
MWNFAHRDELRRALRDALHTAWGQPSRRERVAWAVGGAATWDDWNKSVQPGFYDLSQCVNYITSHDVEAEHEKRILNYLMGPILRWYGRPDHLEHIRWIADHVDDRDGAGRYVVPEIDRIAHGEALERVRSAFALSMTSVGIPMILAGEELGDVHDLDHTDWRLKMSDPVDWSRRDKSDNNRALWSNVRDLVRLRTGEAALQRNEVRFFYWHPAFDSNDGEAVFAYCRTGGAELGSPRQVVTVANLCGRSYGEFHLPWPWRDAAGLREIAPPTHRAPLELAGADWAKLSLAPFQARVFVT